MFADAGMQPPKTWEEMVAAAQKLTDPAKKHYGIALAAGSYTENVHFAFINGRAERRRLVRQRRQADLHR